MPGTQKKRKPKGRQYTLFQIPVTEKTAPQATPGRVVSLIPCQGTLSHASHIKKRRPKEHQRIYYTSWQCTFSHAWYATEAEPQRTPGRTSDPLAIYTVPRLLRKKGRASRKRRQGIHLTPWQCTLSHACHAKAAEFQGTPGHISDPLAVYAVPHLSYKSGGAPRDTRANIGPLGNAPCPTSTTQK